MATTKTVEVTQLVAVTVDETKFTDQFMSDFRAVMYGFDTIDEHIEYLGYLFARGICDEFTKFIEGYGPPKEMGIRFDLLGSEEEIVEQ